MLLILIAVLLTLILCFKIYLNKTTGIYRGNERLDGKTVIITGANSGIGAEAAKDLSSRGARVVMLCRDLVKGEQVRQNIIKTTNNKAVILKHVDFASLSSVRKCANEILAEEEKIDVLINNAGVKVQPDYITEDGLNLMMQINHFGPFLLTNILLDKIKKSAPSRIVNVASYGHHYGTIDLNDLEQKNATSRELHYCNSKLANVYFTAVLAEKLKGTGVTSNCLHPGLVSTSILRDYHIIVKKISFFIFYLFGKNPWEGAQTIIYLSVSPSVADTTGKYFSDCYEKSSRASKDIVKAKKFWQLSERAVNIQDNEKHY